MPKKGKSHNQARRLHAQQKDDDKLPYKEDNQDYGLVFKKLGDKRVMCILPNGKEIMGVVPGKFHKRVWIDVGNIVLLSYRSFQNNKVDIIFRYTPKEARKLHKEDEIPKFFIDGEQKDDIVDVIDFESDEDVDILDENIDLDLI